jgi:hypothetical protein
LNPTQCLLIDGFFFAVTYAKCFTTCYNFTCTIGRYKIRSQW